MVRPTREDDEPLSDLGDDDPPDGDESRLFLDDLGLSKLAVRLFIELVVDDAGRR
jgi:hypothetical protein